jgi:putative ATP-dependent endonuclease of OLD family
MRIKTVKLHNFRSILDGEFDLYDYTLLVGANNAGKSTILSALRIFYDHLKWTPDDLPKQAGNCAESWVDVTFLLTEDEEKEIAEKYRRPDRLLVIRKLLKSAERDVKSTQSNLYAIIGNQLEEGFFYGAKNVSSAKVGDIIYVPALSLPDEHLKTSGQSALRDILNLVLKRAAAKSAKYDAVLAALKEMNLEANQEGGFLSQLSTPLNKALEDWGVKLDLNIRQMSPEDVTKTLVQPAFKDAQIGDTQVNLDRIGHGFQRTLIYELLRCVPQFTGLEKETKKKEYNPDFTLLLFEEPEAFLHPHQQETMFLNLRKLAQAEGQQALITTHSPIFAGRAASDLKSIVRVKKAGGTTRIHQISAEKLDALLGDGLGLAKCLQDFIADAGIEEKHKKKAKEMVANPPTEEIALQDEVFRFQLWLDAERASMFFADHVIVVEGTSEKVLFDYLLQNQWSDLRQHRVYVIDALGKFNIHRFMALLEAFGTRHGVLMDGDTGKHHQEAINDFLEGRTNQFTVGKPHKFTTDLEGFLGLTTPRDDRKPLEILKAVSQSRIGGEKLAELRGIVESSLLGLAPKNAEKTT